MFVTYDRFKSIKLPEYDPEEPLLSWPVHSNYTDLVDGSYRNNGTSKSKKGRKTVRRTGMLLKKVETTDKAALIALQEHYSLLEAMQGTADRLYGRTAGGTFVWTPAELIDVQAVREPRELFRFAHYVALDVETEFLLYVPYWNGLTHGEGLDLGHDPPEYLDTTLVLDYDGSRYDTEFALPNHASIATKTLTLNDDGETLPLHNGGNIPVVRIVATVTAGDAALVGTDLNPIVLAIGGVEWKYRNTIPAGRQLIVQNYSVKTNAVDVDEYVGDYAKFDYPTNQEEWMKIPIGLNAATFRYAGGGTGAKIHFLYNDAWA